MHEMALMSGVFDIIKKYTADIPEKKVTKVTLVIGELSNAVPEALEMAFTVFSQGTAAEGAELEIKEIPLTARCLKCGWEGPVEKYSFSCGACSAVEVEILTGRELAVESLEVE